MHPLGLGFVMDGASVAAMNRAEGSAAQVGCAGHATAKVCTAGRP